VEKQGLRIRKRCLLKDLEIIRVIDNQPFYNLVLLFKKETEMVIKTPTLEDRDKLLSALLTLRSFSFPALGETEHVSIFYNSGVDFA